MNKDKAIQLLERLQDPEPYEPMLTKDAYDAIQMAIDALSADGDTISRKAAIEVINHELRCGVVIDQCGLETAHDLIEELPPAQPEQLGTNLAEVGTDCISRQQAIDVLDVLCQEHRYKIPGKGETYSQYNEAWQDALDRAEGAIFNLPSAQPEIIRCRECKFASGDSRICMKFDHSPIGELDFCAWAERRTDE